MEPINEEAPENVDDDRRPWGAIGLIFVGLLIASAVVFAVYQLTKSDGTETAAVATTSAPNVVASATDEVVTEINQNPSLRLFTEEGTTYVENDGNVTMSSILVLDGAGATVCDLGTISPSDRQPCPGAGDALGPVTATGSGPQGQAVETGLE